MESKINKGFYCPAVQVLIFETCSCSICSQLYWGCSCRTLMITQNIRQLLQRTLKQRSQLKYQSCLSLFSNFWISCPKRILRNVVSCNQFTIFTKVSLQLYFNIFSQPSYRQNYLNSSTCRVLLRNTQCRKNGTRQLSNSNF